MRTVQGEPDYSEEEDDTEGIVNSDDEDWTAPGNKTRIVCLGPIGVSQLRAFQYVNE